ncbi:MAG: ATP F0F1 synthase subunit B [Devosia sp.]
MAGQPTNIILLAQATTAAPGAVSTAGQAAATVGAAANQAGAASTQTATTEAGHSLGFPPFDASTFGAQILWLLICFGVLYVVVARAVVPLVGGIIEARKNKIDGDLAEADRLRKQTDKAIADYEAALAAARTKANSIAEDTRLKAKAELDGKRATVEADLAGKVSVAEASIQKAKTAALGNVDDIAADTAAALVSRLTGTVSADEAKAAVASVVKG